MEDVFGHPFKALRSFHNPTHVMEDLELLKAGILDHESFRNGYLPFAHAVEVEVRSAAGELKHLRRSANLRTDLGGDWLSAALANMGGDSTHNTVNGWGSAVTGTASAATATGITSNLTPTNTNQYVGKLLQMGAVFGVILSHQAAANATFTIDQWYAVPVTGAAGATPTAGTFLILPGMAPGAWLALSNDATAPATTDTALASEIATNGLARAFAAYSHAGVTGGTTSNVTTTYTLSKTFTATGTQAAQKAAVLNAASAGLILLENTFAQVSMISGDTCAVTWTVQTT